MKVIQTYFLKSLIIIGLVCFSVAVASCDDDKDAVNTDNAPATLTMSHERVLIDGLGNEEVTVKVYTNQSHWTVESDQPWCHVGKKDGTFKISLDMNSHDATRPATITVIAGTGKNTKELPIEVTQEGKPEAKEGWRIKIPDFADSYIYTVKTGGKLFGELCKEYLKTSDGGEQVVVFYPAENDVINRIQGYVATNGGSVTWTGTECNYVQGSAGEPKALYWDKSAGEFVSAFNEAVLTDVKPELLTDIRGSEERSYKIVKIGVQIWTAENLKAFHLTDGTPLSKGISSSDPSIAAYKDLNPTESSVHYEVYGLYYNSPAYMDGKIAPAGWKVPSRDDIRQLMGSVNNSLSLIKADSDLWGHWMYEDIEGSNPETDYQGRGSNASGFGAMPGGYIHMTSSKVGVSMGHMFMMAFSEPTGYIQFDGKTSSFVEGCFQTWNPAAAYPIRLVKE